MYIVLIIYSLDGLYVGSIFVCNVKIIKICKGATCTMIHFMRFHVIESERSLGFNLLDLLVKKNKSCINIHVQF